MRRSGFTVLEVLIAAVVLVLGTVGIAGVMGQAMKKSKLPEQIETASILASERIQWFRSQDDPYRAAGGTHYAPPRRGVTTDYNSTAAYNNNYNNAPTLYVREFLYTLDEEKVVRTSALLGTTDEGRRNQGQRANVNAGSGRPNSGINEVPPLTWPYHMVVPNVDSDGPARADLGDVNQAVWREPAPRANPGIVPNSPLPPDIRYVREVWVQTNHPRFPAVVAAADPFNLPVDIQANLPPYTVAVTVKVFPRAPMVKTFKLTAPPANKLANALGEGPGYDWTRPMATMVAYFGLRRAIR